MSKYEILSLVISAFGIIATFSAVFVALWQTRIANSKKIKISIKEDQTAINLDDDEAHFVTLKIVNVGNRRINIKFAGVSFGKVGYSIFVFPEKLNIIESTLVKNLNQEYTLEPEQYVEFNILNSCLQIIASKLLNDEPKYINKKINYRILDMSGKLYRKKSKNKIEKYK